MVLSEGTEAVGKHVDFLMVRAETEEGSAGAPE